MEAEAKLYVNYRGYTHCRKFHVVELSELEMY